ncbi:hypothetical protein CS0771_58940 [Catellatospora sp. IY07-71]|uniref:hypothetical protein n=1 Tax=Catellatospora sp. IY07-71 TaxID=2728827 RepID=UPI001BB428D2|nr:hypothetical protein [Catellatospora sp. IY07-71]BCJ76350.1 hypothetical protein CS0771_58940 [Catellatospora sp. IY07-71]
MNVQELRGRLPLRFERRFRVWSYTVSQRHLVLRSDRNSDHDDTLDVAFMDVAGMKLRHSYDRLSISESVDFESLNSFVGIPQRLVGTYAALDVGDDVHQGFVICRVLEIRVDRQVP